MERSKINSWNNQGLTLIEVLIALAIISIAMIAVIKTSTESIRSTTYLQDKMIAGYVAEQALNEVRLGILKLSGSEEYKQTTEMLGKTWFTRIKQTQTSNQRITKIAAEVAQEELDDDDQAPLIVMEAYLYDPKK